jgi:integrase
MMARQQLPPQIKKVEILDRGSGKSVTRYQVTVDAGKDADGKRRQVRRRYATEREARDALSRVQSDAAAGVFVPRQAVTVDQLCADWLASLHHVRATTARDYSYALAPLREAHGSMPVQKLSRADLDRVLIGLRDGGTVTAEGNTRRPWGSRSLNQSIKAWTLVLAYGMERRELANNAAAGMRKVPREHREMDTYTADEIKTVLLRAADADRNGHLWYLALSGLRRGEIAGLRWEDVDLAGGALTIARNRVQVGAAEVVEGAPKTEASRRTLPMDEGLLAVLKRARAAQAQEKLRAGAAYADSGYVAVNEIGQPYTPGALTNMWHRLTKAAKVRPIRLHDARHTAGTAMHLRGVPLAVIGKWFGHADASITARIYAHSQPDELKAAGETLGAVVTSS